MSQHDFDIANQTAASARADINSALKALASNSSGSVAPTTTYANMTYYNTATNILYKRNEADSAWITLGTIDETAGTFTPSSQRALATEAQAQAGTDNTTLMTPLRTEQHTLSNDLGWGQTWADYKASRSSGTTYTNNTGRPIMVSVAIDMSNGYYFVKMYVNDLMIVDNRVDVYNTTYLGQTAQGIVPNGNTYRIDHNGTVETWAELR